MMKNHKIAEKKGNFFYPQMEALLEWFSERKMD